VTLGRPHHIVHLPFAKRPRRLPTVLSPTEVLSLLEAALPGRDRMLLELALKQARFESMTLGGTS
jgi:integrase